MNNLSYNFDSKEEEYFYYWLEELKNQGYIEWIFPHQKTYVVMDAVVKHRPKSFNLTRERKYTPDFIFKFNNKARGIFYYDEEEGYKNRPFLFCNNNRGIIYVDIKGSFTRNLSSSVTFPDRQSIMLNRYNIYVQKTIPYDVTNRKKNTLFAKTFTPDVMIKREVYKKTIKNKWNKGDSKLKYKVTKLDKFI